MSARRRHRLGLILPLVVTIITQLDTVQSSTATVIGVGVETIADVLAPAYVVSLIVVAQMVRLRLEPDPRRGSAGWWMATAARGAQVGGASIAALAWVREAGGLTGAAGGLAYAATTILTLALLVVPLAGVRAHLGEAINRLALESRASRRVITFLFHPRSAEGTPSRRWSHAATLAAVTLMAAYLAGGELSALLAGMHPTDRPPAVVADLSDAWSFDLDAKPGAIEGVVETWRGYQETIGGGFTSPRTVVGWHALVTVLGLIPGYLVLGGVAVLGLVGRATGVDHRGLVPSGDPRVEALRRMGSAALAALAAIAAVHVAERLLAWHLVATAWDGTAVTTKAALILWALTLVRAISMALLAVFLAAMVTARVRKESGRGFDAWSRPGPIDLRSLLALRAGILVLGLVVAALFVPVQMADVARRLTVSNTVAAVLLASILAMMIEQHASTMLRLRRRHVELKNAGTPPAPRRIRAGGRSIPLRRAVVAGIVAVAALQLTLDVLFEIPVGRGLVIPVLTVAAIWLLGLPLDEAPFLRGTAPPSDTIATVAPRLLGATVFVVLGAAVFRASVGHLAYSGRVDGFIVLAVVPLAMGMWRLLRSEPERAGIPEVLIAAALLAIGLRMTFGVNPELTPSALTVAGVFLLYGSIPFYFSYTPGSPPARLVRWLRMRLARLQPIRVALFLLPLGLAVALVADPLGLPPVIGAFAAMLLFCILVFGAVGWAVRFAEVTRPPRLLAAMRLRRTPVLALGVLWIVLAPIVTRAGAHDVRILEPSTHHGVRGIGIDAVWDRYLAANLRRAANATDPGARAAMPLILVSSSGGGARAAVWTAYVLDCLFAPQPVPGNTEVCPGAGESWRSATPVAVVAGISGGGLGLSAFFVYSLEAPTGGDWVAERLGDDYLSPAFSWLALVDVPRTLLGFSTGIPDRGEILERAWESSWPGPLGLDLGMFELWLEHPEVPPMVFSAASVLDGCRFNASVLDAAVEVPGARCSSLAPFDANRSALKGDAFLPATNDLVDYLCPDEDVRLSTAVLTGARFPILSPMGRVAGTGACPTKDPAFVVDGGYFEGSGSATVLDVYEALQPLIERHNAGSDVCIVPFLIHIDNGYEVVYRGSKTAPRELLAPFVTLSAARPSWVASARIESALVFDTPLRIAGAEIEVVAIGDDGSSRPLASRYARLTTRSHPGVQAPLGWSLSGASIEDLRLQLGTSENRGELAEIFGWLDGALECRPQG